MNGNVIEIENADLLLGGKKVLKNLSWQVKQGEHHFILGANGAGKTSLVKVMMGYLWPVYGGKVKVLDTLFGHGNLIEMRKKIAWLSPFLHDWPPAGQLCLDLVVSGLDATIGMTKREPTTAELGHASELMCSLDCEHLADEDFAKISSGEQLKILIARSLIAAPELLILDEPCVHLDLKSREFLLENIDKLAAERKDITIIFVTQRIEDISRAFPKGTILKHGEIIAEGKREDILTEEKLSQAFELNIKLSQTANGRIWARIEDHQA